MDKNALHIPVLLQESIDSLKLSTGMTAVDCTVNRGGHAELIAKAIGKEGTLIIFDLDKKALNYSTNRLNNLADCPKIIPIHSNYREIKSKLEELGINKVDAVFADLGLSSQELEISGRGFTFQKDEPLHMTFQSEISPETFTAKDLINNLSIEKLTNIFKAYGNEPQSYKIASAIFAYRQTKAIETTGELVEVIIGAVGKKPWQKTHPATKIFQAIRIAVNDEYEGIKQLIRDGFEILSSQGQMSIITFHSGEDKIVKEIFRDLFANNKSSKQEKKKPKEEEIKNNPRSRSAILRTITKI